jgi:hypothetical protein
MAPVVDATGQLCLETVVKPIKQQLYYRTTVVVIGSELLKVNMVRKCQNMPFFEEISVLIPLL